MANHLLGVKEIKENELVKQMCHFSTKFKEMVQLVFEIEDEINKNNDNKLLRFSDLNNSLKREKLLLKRKIQHQMNSFIDSPDLWKKTYGDTLPHNSMEPKKAKNQNQNQTGQSKRSRQCRKRNVGKAANR